MADSDNTTTLPSVTPGRKPRSSLIAGHPKPLVGHATEDPPLADPALVLSLAWIDAHVGMLASCVRQQQAEAGLLASGALFPVGEVIGRGEGACADRDCPDFLKEEQLGLGRSAAPHA
jgi:hypothetical protein